MKDSSRSPQQTCSLNSGGNQGPEGQGLPESVAGRQSRAWSRVQLLPDCLWGLQVSSLPLRSPSRAPHAGTGHTSAAGPTNFLAAKIKGEAGLPRPGVPFCCKKAALAFLLHSGFLQLFDSCRVELGDVVPSRLFCPFLRPLPARSRFAASVSCI